MEPARHLLQRPLELSEQVHDAAEGVGHRHPFAAQLLDFALEHAQVAAELAALSTELLTLALPRLESLAQAIPILDQRRDHATQHVLAFDEPPPDPLLIFERLCLGHLPWCLLRVTAGLLFRTRGLGRGLAREVDELVRGSRGEPGAVAGALDGAAALGD